MGCHPPRQIKTSQGVFENHRTANFTEVATLILMWSFVIVCVYCNNPIIFLLIQHQETLDTPVDKHARMTQKYRFARTDVFNETRAEKDIDDEI